MSLEEITGDYFRPDWIDFPLAHYSEQSPNTSGLRYSDYAPWDGSFSQRVNISGGAKWRHNSIALEHFSIAYCRVDAFPLQLKRPDSG